MTGSSMYLARGPIDGRSVLIPREVTLKINSHLNVSILFLILKLIKKEKNFFISPRNKQIKKLSVKMNAGLKSAKV